MPKLTPTKDLTLLSRQTNSLADGMEFGNHLALNQRKDA